MDDYSPAEMAFSESIKRARDLCELQAYLSKQYKILDTTDMLRASVVLGVSAFDYIAHELYRIEVQVRYRESKKVDKLSLPFSIGAYNDSNKHVLIDQFVRESNSHKTFVDPGKLSDALGCFIKHPWKNIADCLSRKEDDVKAQIRRIYSWRNRIAHEADINPAMAGVERWPIEKSDVMVALSDLETTGLAIAHILRAEHASAAQT